MRPGEASGGSAREALDARARRAREARMDDPAALLWSLAGALLALAAFSVWAEHRRQRRKNLDRPGWVPWNLVQLLAFLLAIACAALALKA